MIGQTILHSQLNSIPEFPMFPSKPLLSWQRTEKQWNFEAKCLGLPPILSVEKEGDIKAWIVGMQCQGFPVSREAILIKGNALFHSIFGNTRQVGLFKCG
jgi:hypothetical protein